MSDKVNLALRYLDENIIYEGVSLGLGSNDSGEFLVSCCTHHCTERMKNKKLKFIHRSTVRSAHHI